MDLVISKTDLLRLCALCAPVADKKSAMPALANVLLTAERGLLRASATNLYQGVSSPAPADVATPGSVAVPAKDLLDRVKMMPAGPVQILVNVDTSAMTLKAVGSPRRYTLHGIPGSDFPPMPKVDADAPTASMRADLLGRLFDRTHVSISTDETRPHVNSLFVEMRGALVRAVSTDGHRLTKMDATLPTAIGLATTMLIPLAAVGDLRRLFADAEKGVVVTLAQSGPNAFVTVGDVTYWTKLVDAQFPPWEQVVPKDLGNSARAPKAAFADAIKAIKVASSGKTGGIKLSFAANTVRVESESPESGSAFDELAIDFAGAPVTIGFNAQYVLDALDAIDADEVLLAVSGDLDPMLARPGAESEGGSFLAVLMPMRI